MNESRSGTTQRMSNVLRVEEDPHTDPYAGDDLDTPFFPEEAAEYIAELQPQIDEVSPRIQRVRDEIAQAIVGQHNLIDSLLIGLLTNSHVLLEGVPGLAKTATVNALASCIAAKFQRVQFTPDLLPADVLGTMIYNPRTQEYTTKFGPIFCNILLADEINRCPPKVQSALLEAMQEHQVTLGDKTYKLEDPFLVLATENPVEQEGTYPLPEAQVDRFMLKVFIDYPTAEEELQILEFIANKKAKTELEVVITPKQIKTVRQLVEWIYLSDQVKQYIVNLVIASRHPGKVSKKLAELIRYGASPRATINLTLACRAQAFLQGRAYVIPDDVKAVAPGILGHRILTTYEADAENMTSYDIVDALLKKVPVP
ncbi:MoxR family ATPase [Kiritimatiellaeota bacterium B1221]|nr:MoxR family ATPase [Kiritimatiellaeota bacterium B1221]